MEALRILFAALAISCAVAPARAEPEDRFNEGVEYAAKGMLAARYCGHSEEDSLTIVNLGLTRARLAAYLAKDKAMDDNKIMGLVMRRSIEIVDELEPDFERNEPLIEEFCSGVPK